MKKRLLIHVCDSNITRNILRTEVLGELIVSKEFERIFIVATEKLYPRYKEEFTSDKVEVLPAPKTNLTKLETTFWFLAKHTIHTNNVYRKMDEIRDRSTGSKLMRETKYWIAKSVFYLSKFRPIDVLIKKLTIWAFEDKRFQPIFEAARPDIVFLPTTFGNNDTRLLKYCLKNNVPNVGMIKSWDNLLGKDPFILSPDELIVHSKTVRSIVLDMHDYPEEKIHVTGLPQYDVYVDKDFSDNRVDFFAELGLDPEKKLITYTAMGSWIVIYEKEFIERLAELAKQNKFNYPVQVLVRLHPAYKSDDELLENIQGITLERPGNSNFDSNPWRADFEFEESDTRRLVNTLKHSDVIVNSGSTTTIDAAAMDTPVINVAYDATDEKIPFESSAERLLIKEHYLPILESGGARVVKSEEEFIEAVNEYLDDPGLDHAGRMRIIDEHCHKLDGRSGERVANVIINAAERT